MGALSYRWRCVNVSLAYGRVDNALSYRYGNLDLTLRTVKVVV